MTSDRARHDDRAGATVPVTVPFLDLRAVNARYGERIQRAIADVLASGRYLHGAQVVSFEQAFAAFCGRRHCIAVANGLDALRLTLRAWVQVGRLAPGDEVIVPANSFVASALAVTDAGLVVRFADVDCATRNMTADTLRAAIGPRSRVVMPVHLYGQLADPQRIGDLCRSAGLLVLEDAAQAHGARHDTVHAGAFGDAGAFSFYPSKNLGALGDAGAVITDDDVLAAHVRAIANYGRTPDGDHAYLGVNSRMDELQAVVLRARLEGLDADNAVRRTIATRYGQELDASHVRLPAAPAHAGAHVWHIYAVTTERRDRLAAHLRARGIETSVHYRQALHRHPAYAASGAHAPCAERLAERVLSLPIGPAMTSGQVDRVVAAVNAWRGD